MNWSDLLLLIYPLIETHRALKYSRLQRVKHWLIFWYLWILLELIETFTFGFIPFWGMIKPGLLIINCKPSVSEITNKFLNVWIRHTWIKVKNIEEVQGFLDFIKGWSPVSKEQILGNFYIQWIIWWLGEDDQQTKKKQL